MALAKIGCHLSKPLDFSTISIIILLYRDISLLYSICFDQTKEMCISLILKGRQRYAFPQISTHSFNHSAFSAIAIAGSNRFHRFPSTNNSIVVMTVSEETFEKIAALVGDKNTPAARASTRAEKLKVGQ